MNEVPIGLLQFVEAKLKWGLESWSGFEEAKCHLSTRFLGHILGVNKNLDSIRTQGLFVSKSLRNNPSDVLSLEETSMEAFINTYSEKRKSNKRMFDEISDHHNSLRNESNLHGSREYCKAAEQMGEMEWVKFSLSWIKEFILSYYSYTVSSSVKAVEFECRNTKIQLSQQMNAIKLLDVGSCYNFFSQFKEFDVTAIDLFPANDSVIKCDFLKATIDSSATDLVISDDGDLVCIPSLTYNAIVLSLVLSYVPLPSQRLEMIARARKTLITSSEEQEDEDRTPSQLAGILLVCEKFSVLHASSPKHYTKYLKHWKETISSQGFTLLKYQVLQAKGKKSHLFAFAASSSSPPSAAVARAGLFIKQDFEGKDESTIATAIGCDSF